MPSIHNTPLRVRSRASETTATATLSRIVIDGPRFSRARSLLLMIVAAAAMGAAVACGSSAGTTASANMPEQNTAARYEFIEAHQDLAQHTPCYCGCGPQGHASLRDCFLAADGSYEQHGAWCHICLEEARDIERLQAEGVSPSLIRAYIDGEYSRFGPPTNTP